jgi:hypothetical protein
MRTAPSALSWPVAVEVGHAGDGCISLPGAPLPGPPRGLALPSLGGRLVRKRVTCCLFYALPGCEYRPTCPVFSDERVAELAAERLSALDRPGRADDR